MFLKLIQIEARPRRVLGFLRRIGTISFETKAQDRGRNMDDGKARQTSKQLYLI